MRLLLLLLATLIATTPPILAQTLLIEGIDAPRGLEVLDDGRILVGQYREVGSSVPRPTLSFDAAGNLLGEFAPDDVTEREQNHIGITQLSDGRVAITDFPFAFDAPDLLIFEVDGTLVEGFDAEYPIDVDEEEGGTLLVSEYYDARIVRYSPETGRIGTAYDLSAEGLYVWSVLIRDDDVLASLDATQSGPGRIIRIAEDGTISSFTGYTGMTRGGKMEVLSDGRILVTDRGAGLIHGFEADGTPLGVLASVASGQTIDVHVGEGDEVLFLDRQCCVYSLNLPVGAEQEAPGQGAFEITVAPSPTSGWTSIHFALARAKAARIEVFDMTGRRVLSLPERVLGPGEHTLALPAQNLISGTYVVRVRVGDRIATRLLTVAR